MEDQKLLLVNFSTTILFTTFQKPANMGFSFCCWPQSTSKKELYFLRFEKLINIDDIMDKKLTFMTQVALTDFESVLIQ
jgi:hypothetical protein